MAITVLKELFVIFVEKYPRTPAVQIGDLMWDFLLVPIVWCYYALSFKRIPTLFLQLQGVALQQDTREFVRFLNKTRRRISTRWTSRIAVSLTLISVPIMVFGIWSKNPPPYYHYPAHMVYSLGFGSLTYYMFYISLLREISVIFLLAEFLERFHLKIDILNADNAGGLGFIGSYYFEFAFLGVIIGMFISVWSIVVPVLEGTAILWDPVWALAWCVYILITPTILFFPLWLGHKAMERQKEKLLNSISFHFNDELLETVGSIDKGGKILERRKQQIQSVRELRALMDDVFPTWPYSTQLRRRFSITALAPIITSIVSLVIDYIK
ncbi:MAG TPA: hypothetical protein PKD09_11435 [Aggregatilinea sp.]|uniref:hypothetical protein n=1 Tax=Aggregatilinea sp. TaxID=2806333 RepID=UPI002CAFFE47|nr:hypothetical protein [Aggregatilinea sp.]HML22253.1 hypothetical protein [Aggregatilinea sp.]